MAGFQDLMCTLQLGQLIDRARTKDLRVGRVDGSGLCDYSGRRLSLLDRGTDAHKTVAMTGHSTAHKEEILILIDTNHFQIQHRRAGIAMLTRQLHSFEDATRPGASADGTGVSKSFVGPVRTLLDLEAVDASQHP